MVRDVGSMCALYVTNSITFFHLGPHLGRVSFCQRSGEWGKAGPVSEAYGFMSTHCVLVLTFEGMSIIVSGLRCHLTVSRCWTHWRLDRSHCHKPKNQGGWIFLEEDIMWKNKRNRPSRATIFVCIVVSQNQSCLLVWNGCDPPRVKAWIRQPCLHFWRIFGSAS